MCITTTCELVTLGDFDVFYHEVKGAKYIVLAKIRADMQLKGEIFNIYSLNGSKYGCEYDGISVASSIEAFENKHNIEYENTQTTPKSIESSCN